MVGSRLKGPALELDTWIHITAPSLCIRDSLVQATDQLSFRKLENGQKAKGGHTVGVSAKVTPQEQPDEEAATGYLPPAHTLDALPLRIISHFSHHLCQWLRLCP